MTKSRMEEEQDECVDIQHERIMDIVRERFPEFRDAPFINIPLRCKLGVHPRRFCINNHNKWFGEPIQVACFCMRCGVVGNNPTISGDGGRITGRLGYINPDLTVAERSKYTLVSP